MNFDQKEERTTSFRIFECNISIIIR